MVLSENWFVEGRIDFEMQKYRLLAYLRDIESSFEARRLYPPLLDLRRHYVSLESFQESRRRMQDGFPQRIAALDLRSGRISREPAIEDDAAMTELSEITTFALSRMQRTLETGTGIYQTIERRMAVEPVGINPPRSNQGYFLLRLSGIRETRAYSYRLRDLDTGADSRITLSFLGAWPVNLVNTTHSIKLELVRNASALHNPAAYVLETDLNMPVEQTLLPVATQVFGRYLAGE